MNFIEGYLGQGSTPERLDMKLNDYQTRNITNKQEKIIRIKFWVELT